MRTPQERGWVGDYVPYLCSYVVVAEKEAGAAWLGPFGRAAPIWGGMKVSGPLRVDPNLLASLPRSTLMYLSSYVCKTQWFDLNILC